VVVVSLKRKVGRKAAFELVGTGEPVDAARAFVLGLVNRVVAPDKLMATALQFAHVMAVVDPQPMAATKELFYRAADLPFDEALEAGRDINQRMRSFSKGK
jgi:enoyl-CoA hydratase